MSENFENGHGSLIDRGNQELRKLQEIFVKLANDILDNKLTDQEKENLVKDLTPDELIHLQKMLRDHAKDREKE